MNETKTEFSFVKYYINHRKLVSLWERIHIDNIQLYAIESLLLKENHEKIDT